MYDNQIFQILLPIINTGLTTRGVTGVTVTQNNQPTQQGAVTGPAVYIHKLFNTPNGWVAKDDNYNSLSDTIVHNETQFDDVSFQVTTLVTEDPADDAALTASDLANIVKGILQSDEALQTLATNRLGIQWIPNVPNPFFKDDRDNFEAAASFDFVITNTTETLSTTPPVNTIQYGFYRI